MPDRYYEVRPQENSGKNPAICFFMYSLGILSASLFRLLFGYLFNDDYHHLSAYLIILFPIITCLIRMTMLIIFFNFDTPRYYIS